MKEGPNGSSGAPGQGSREASQPQKAGQEGSSLPGQAGGGCTAPGGVSGLGVELSGPDVNSCGRDSESQEGLEAEACPAGGRLDMTRAQTGPRQLCPPALGSRSPALTYLSIFGGAPQARLLNTGSAGLGDDQQSAFEDALRKFLQRFFA